MIDIPDTPQRGKWIMNQTTGELEPYEAPQKVYSTSIITDRMEPIAHMANGKVYDSKSKFREVTKMFGLVEVGNDKPSKPRNKDAEREKRREEIRDDMAKAQNDLRYNQAPLTEEEREVCKQQDKLGRDYNYDNRPRDKWGNL